METINIYSLPPGFGFHPTDAELISHYLKRKILGLKIEGEVIPEVDIYKCEPWDLPAKCHIPTRDFKWHFFASRDRKYPNGSRTNRATEAGYWKSTGKDRCIRSRNQVIGTKKTLVFHEGRPPLGKRTEWIMHEYYISDDLCKASPKMKDIFVLCRVTKRNGCTVDDTDLPPENEETNACPNTPKDVPVLLVQKESPCSTGTPEAEDIEAWINELCVPDLCPIPTIHDLESASKEDFCSVTLKQEPVYLQTEFLDGSHFFDCEGLQSLEPSDALNSGVLGEFSIGSAFSASTPKLNSAFLPGDFSFPKFTLNGDIGDYTSSSINESDIKLFDPTDRIKPNSDSCPIIQVRDRRDRPSAKGTPTFKSNLRVYNKLEVHKMESNNNIRVNLTMNFASQDHHLDQNDGFAQNPPTIGLEKKNFSAKLTSSSFYPTELISEKSISEAEPKNISSAQGLIRARFLLKSRFFLCACVIGAALIIIYFLMRDS